MAGNAYFKFKQFTVYQEDVSMRVNTDGVLLGAWCRMPENNGAKILDIGTGTGVIALMAAQRMSANFSDFEVGAVEPDSPSCIQAVQNFKASPWRRNLKIFMTDFQQFVPLCQDRYGLIVSNPPYFVDSLKNPSISKRLSRHTDNLPYEDIIAGAKKILAAGGRLSVILPYEESKLFISIAEENGFSKARICRVFAKEGDELPKRMMIEFSLGDNKKAEVPSDDLCIMDSNLEFTSAYKALTGDFYLKF
ncbi:MAG: methyltransferase [Bacteroidales bacterium]|nr:methyltransferase [Bacteroidales bacterium]